MKQLPSNNLKQLSVTNIVATIQNYEYDVKDMDLRYEALKEKESIDVELDDLLFISMKIAFLEGARFQERMTELFNRNHN